MIKSVLFFHARKFDDQTNLLLSFHNEVILIVDSDIDKKVLTCQVKISSTWCLSWFWWCLMMFASLKMTILLLLEMSFFKYAWDVILSSKRWRSPWFLWWWWQCLFLLSWDRDFKMLQMCSPSFFEWRSSFLKVLESRVFEVFLLLLLLDGVILEMRWIVLFDALDDLMSLMLLDRLLVLGSLHPSSTIFMLPLLIVVTFALIPCWEI